MGHTVQKRNWKGIVIALVVIIAVCALIVATIVLLQPSKYVVTVAVYVVVNECVVDDDHDG